LIKNAHSQCTYLLQLAIDVCEDTGNSFELAILGDIRRDEKLYHGASTVQHLKTKTTMISESGHDLAL
jgi:hypothetical protein